MLLICKVLFLCIKHTLNEIFSIGLHVFIVTQHNVYFAEHTVSYLGMVAVEWYRYNAKTINCENTQHLVEHFYKVKHWAMYTTHN